MTDKPETQIQAKTWHTVMSHALKYGLCHRCAGQLAYGHQLGFSRLTETPCADCAPVIATLPRSRPNGWRTVTGTAHSRRAWEGPPRPAGSTPSWGPSDPSGRRAGSQAST